MVHLRRKVMGMEKASLSRRCNDLMWTYDQYTNNDPHAYA